MKMIGIRLRTCGSSLARASCDPLGEGVDPFRHQVPGARDLDVDLGMVSAPRGDGPLVARQDDG